MASPLTPDVVTTSSQLTTALPPLSTGLIAARPQLPNSRLSIGTSSAAPIAPPLVSPPLQPDRVDLASNTVIAQMMPIGTGAIPTMEQIVDPPSIGSLLTMEQIAGPAPIWPLLTMEQIIGSSPIETQMTMEQIIAQSPAPIQPTPLVDLASSEMIEAMTGPQTPAADLVVTSMEALIGPYVDNTSQYSPRLSAFLAFMHGTGPMSAVPPPTMDEIIARPQPFVDTMPILLGGIESPMVLDLNLGLSDPSQLASTSSLALVMPLGAADLALDWQLDLG